MIKVHYELAGESIKLLWIEGHASDVDAPEALRDGLCGSVSGICLLLRKLVGGTPAKSGYYHVTFLPDSVSQRIAQQALQTFRELASNIESAGHSSDKLIQVVKD